MVVGRFNKLVALVFSLDLAVKSGIMEIFGIS